MNKTFEVCKGMEVWLEPTGNLARRGVEPVRGVIVSIGRKYFYVSVPGAPHFQSIKFEIETFHSCYDDNAGFVIYPSFDAFKTEKTVAAKLRKIGSAITYAQNLNRTSDHTTIPSSESVDRVYQILQGEGLVPEWKEDMMYGR